MKTRRPPLLSKRDKTIEKLKKNETLVIYQDDEDSWIHEEVEAGRTREICASLNSQLLLPVGAKNELSGVISLEPETLGRALFAERFAAFEIGRRANRTWLWKIRV